MAKVTVTKIVCERKQDVTGKDEPVLKIAGQERWSGKMGNDDIEYPNESEPFTTTISVQLLERNENNPNKDKVLNSWVLNATPTGAKTLTATSSGFHYTVYATVS
ncbi:hypothetical protein [Actinoplanes sp. GCM10030250]|uniref:hypothetical protein n=1 Tax=Actinoplanes sp. GCM10030250 TaxID=3273376 RepID=UPI003611E418